MSASASGMFQQLDSRPAVRQQNETSKIIIEQRSGKWLHGLVISGMFALIAWGIWLLSQPGTLPIQTVSITGDFRHLQPDKLQTLVSNEVRGGFFNVNVSTIRDILMQDPWVEDVMVQRVWPETLRVMVSEHVPQIRWGEHSLLNTHGQLFTPDAASIPEQLPMLDGPEGSEALLLRRFREINQRLQPSGLMVSKLKQDSRRSWKFEVDAGFTVVLGRKEFNQRLQRFVTLVPQAMAGRIDQIESVDMRYTNGFSVNWKKTELNKVSGQFKDG